ncbi:MAG: MATE family efflux transporter [candidate division KSB1 bacterium]|nr:MATE family efflux transporter [candidate division KSB1 bacterium]MDZ7272726.1 MATE family efflux transporter [candidate division KSB1 bacterium]MDZ7284249.1 MATE family efflux transporter [candidate division KSB1 bacterium]MDZ7297352.1 MATE family efflux transporter [candidate division KSB1 bacterium]MDZ7307061.1 MATE family efflux transporter [candidate division KSB1 bacterium]
MTGKSSPGKFDRELIDGPMLRAFWKLAWPTVLQNFIGGLQGIIDHVMVGRLVGYSGNAAIGVSWQIFLVVVVFISSVFSGMGVLVARFAGAGEAAKVNRVVYQAFLTAFALSCLVLAPLGYLCTPPLLELVHAQPAVTAEALPYLRLMFVCSIGMLTFFMLGGALRSAGDAKTPLRLGMLMTMLNLIFNFLFIPVLGTAGAALGTVLAAGVASALGIYLLFSQRLVVQFSRAMNWRPDWSIITSLFRFGLPTGFQGVAMNLAGVMMLRFIGSLSQSAAAHAAYAIGYTELFSLITWTSVGLMSATAALTGQNLGAGRIDRARLAAHTAARLGLTLAATVGALFLFVPVHLLALFGMREPAVVQIGVQLLHHLSISGLFITVALVYTGGLQGTGDTRSPLYITLIAQIIVPLGYCGYFQFARDLQAGDVWRAIVLGHLTRAVLTYLRFRQGKWAAIKVDIKPAKV